MLGQWFAPEGLESFMAQHFGREPCARPGAAADAARRFDWEVLDDVLGQRPTDVLVASRGRLVEEPIPRDRADVRRLMDRQLGVVIRQAERHHRGLAELAQALATDVPGVVHVQLYVTPAGTQTFGWHFDAEDVFIIQAVGTKDYYMRANTVTPRDPDPVRTNFGAVQRETSPLMLARLIPSDWLYIPARWWHLVRSVEDALSISIGIVPA
jgi:ribosomal protein L16 Arg81 hydroxylase